MTEPGPGIFERCEDLETAERLYGISMEGGCDEQHGSVERGSLWAGLIADAIVYQDGSGFFTYHLYGSEAEAREVWEASTPNG